MKKHTFTIALIGGIASGKSTVLNFFRNLNIDCISADDVAKDIMKINQPAYIEIVKHLGQGILLPNHELDRNQLREKLLQDVNFKQWLENLTHPLIRKKLKTFQQNAQSKYCVLEIPLLKQRMDYEIDRVLLIKTSKYQQKQFLAKRGLNSAEIEALLDIQIPMHVRESLADDILDNHGSLDDLQKQIHALHEKYLLLSHHNLG